LRGVGTDFVLLLDARDAATEMRVFSRRYDGTVPDVLHLKLDAPQLYLGEQKEVKGQVAVKLGDAELPGASLSLELIDEQDEVIGADTVAGLQSRGTITFNIADAEEEGDYRIKARVLDGAKRRLAEKEISFNLVEPPF